jgi:hypothetical protein
MRDQQGTERAVGPEPLPRRGGLGLLSRRRVDHVMVEPIDARRRTMLKTTV